jgi:hypothetical protein
LSRDAQGRVLASRERRELLLEQYDRSGMSGVKFAEYIGIKYSTLVYWLQSRRCKREREKLLLRAIADTEPNKSNGAWVEAVVENGSPPRAQVGALRIYFAGGAYCQISSGAEAAGLMLGVAFTTRSIMHPRKQLGS